MTGSKAGEAQGSTAGLLDGGGSPGGLAGRRGCSFPSCCSKQGKLTEEARRGAASGDAAGRRGWTASRAAEGGGDEGKGAAERMGQGPIEEEGGEGIGRRFFLVAQTRGTRSRWIGRMVGLGLKGAAGPRRKWAGLAATVVGSWWAEGE